MAVNRQNRSDASIAVEDLHSHPRGGVGISVAVHADLGDSTVVGGVRNVEPVIGFAKLQFAGRLHPIAVTVVTVAFRSAKPQSIRRKRNSRRAVQTLGDDGSFAMGANEPDLAGIRSSAIRFCDVDISGVRHC